MNLSSPSSLMTSTSISPFTEKRRRPQKNRRSLGGSRNHTNNNNTSCCSLQCHGCEAFLLPQAFAKPQRSKGSGLATCRQCVWKELMLPVVTLVPPTTTTTCTSSTDEADDVVPNLCPTDTLDTVASSFQEDDIADDDDDDDVSSLAATHSIATPNHHHPRTNRLPIPVSPNVSS